MKQTILVLILHVIVSTCYLVHAENPARISKTDCGMRAELKDMSLDRTETTVSQWPWVASIYFVDRSNSELEYYGTASIITNRHLITVAQVVTPRNTTKEIRPEDFIAVVGEFAGQDINYEIRNIFINCLNKEQAFLGGVAVVQLMNAMTLTDWKRPVCLPNMEDIVDIHQKQSLTAVGWSYSSNNISETKVLYEVDVPILSEEFCQQFIPGTYPSETLICGENSNETCKIGNGAPLMASKNDKFTLVGLTDGGIGQKLICGKPEIPIYFIKVASYVGWIASIIQESME